LDNIRVVRNDLTDADLEIVPGKAVRHRKAASRASIEEPRVLAAARPR
jgi:hypothetical protein